MAENVPGQDPQMEDPRIGSLRKRLARLDASVKSESKPQAIEADENYRLGNRVLADLIGGIAGGLLFGWLLDRWLGTSPWLLIAFLFLGIVVAFRNIIRTANEHAARHKQGHEKPGDNAAGSRTVDGADEDF